jgi:hypothetical protein
VEHIRAHQGIEGHTIYCGCQFSDEKMDDFACSLMNKVIKMRDFDVNGCSEEQDSEAKLTGRDLSADEDTLMEEILDNISTTPLGQVLKKIASLPEIRRDKVLEIRRRLTKGQYDLGERLDIALDKVLEDLTTQKQNGG